VAETSALRPVALGANAALLAAGAFVLLRPRLPTDPWAGSALLGMALLNLAALVLTRVGLARRLHRIAVLANALLLLAAALFLAASLIQRARALEVLAAVGLAVPPLLTGTALRQPGV
jgi:hypothetical protein